MNTLHIAPNLQLPAEAVTETFAILAKRGVGKTYTASVLVEELLKAGLHVVVADPIGVWWGLRASSDGTSAGLPIVVLGGDHGDVPLEATSGELIADLVVDERLSIVLDLSLFRKGEQVRFMTDFAEKLYHHNRAPLQLVLDEADAFAPQRPQKGQERMLGAIEDLVRRGRARGIGVTLITQRSAVLNKDVLTQVEVLIALRTIAPQDREAIDAWVKVHGTPEQREELMQSLPSLPIGTAWFWSPGWLDIFQRVQVRKRETFDSSATPKVGAKVQAPKQLADVDIASLRTRLAATIERAKQDDPRELRRQVASLRQQLQAKPAAEIRIERVEVPIFQEDEIKALQDATEQLRGVGDLITQVVERIVDALTRSTESAFAEMQLQAAQRIENQVAGPNVRQLPVAAPKPTPVPPPEALAMRSDITAPQQRILNALAEFAALGLPAVARSNAAVWAVQSPTSSGYTNNLGRLRSLGLIDYPSGGQVALTETGRAIAAPMVPSLTSVEQLQDAWCLRLPNPQARILRVLIGRYPRAINRVELADASGQSVTSSGYTNNLGALRSLGLLDYPRSGQVVATALLFPEIKDR